ncbi:MAG: tRNA (guanosine(37)-N1)-methyltransferase TrmD [Candidatus Falkowbacteria bacterium]|nr:tRNA (guanosine(37)-N1)-methyltransferase TrmD [Candidatus Falkowbacteria bacterium]
MKKFKIITIFPEILNSYYRESIIKRACDKKIIDIENYNLRDWTTDHHKTVDDTPYGGGAGMLMKIEPLYKAIQAVKKGSTKKTRKIVLMAASGNTWSQKKAKEYAKLDELIIICGRYEGVDARIKEFVDEEISIGDYVLTGGELGAAVIIDSITRLLPGVLGNEESAMEESHSEEGVLEYPQYTRPEVFKVGKKNYPVPRVLLEGNHKLINEWRKKEQRRK